MKTTNAISEIEMLTRMIEALTVSFAKAPWHVRILQQGHQELFVSALQARIESKQVEVRLAA